MARKQATVLALMSAVLLAGAAQTGQAQDAASTNSGFARGGKLVSAGFMTGGDYSGTGFGGQVEWGVGSVRSSVLSVGAFAGIQRKSTGAGPLEVTTSAMPIMAVGNVHFPIGSAERLDIYAGASAGVVRVSVKSSNGTLGESKASDTDTALGIQAGVRYRAASRLSFMGQLGLVDLPLILAGVSLRL